MAPICEVCHLQDSKYKCPICVLRYCSIACYKTHKTEHDSQPSESTQAQAQAQTITDFQPRQTNSKENQKPATSQFENFDRDPELQALLKRYPLLRIQLQTIYGLTLDPGPATNSETSPPTTAAGQQADESDLSNATSGARSSIKPASPSRGSPGKEVRWRGGSGPGARGGRNASGIIGRGGRREGWGGEDSNSDRRESRRGPFSRFWSQERGDREALGALRRMAHLQARGDSTHGTTTRLSERERELAEGVREFIALCRIRFSAVR